MDGTLEQQIQKLKIYQVKIDNFAANFWMIYYFRLLLKVTDQRLKSLLTIIKKSKKPLFSTTHIPTTLWNIFMLVWNIWEQPLPAQSTKSKTRYGPPQTQTCNNSVLSRTIELKIWFRLWWEMPRVFLPNKWTNSAPPSTTSIASVYFLITVLTLTIWSEHVFYFYKL